MKARELKVGMRIEMLQECWTGSIMDAIEQSGTVFGTITRLEYSEDCADWNLEIKFGNHIGKWSMCNSSYNSCIYKVLKVLSNKVYTYKGDEYV